MRGVQKTYSHRCATYSAATLNGEIMIIYYFHIIFDRLGVFVPITNVES